MWRKSDIDFKSRLLRKDTNLTELLHLLLRVGVQLLGHVLHPEQGAAVLGAGLLHAAHGQPRVRDGAVAEGLHLLVQATQRRP